MNYSQQKYDANAPRSIVDPGDNCSSSGYMMTDMAETKIECSNSSEPSYMLQWYASASDALPFVTQSSFFRRSSSVIASGFVINNFSGSVIFRALPVLSTHSQTSCCTLDTRVVSTVQSPQIPRFFSHATPVSSSAYCVSHCCIGWQSRFFLAFGYWTSFPKPAVLTETVSDAAVAGDDFATWCICPCCCCLRRCCISS